MIDTIDIVIKTKSLEQDFQEEYYSKLPIKERVYLELILNENVVPKFINPDIIDILEDNNNFFPLSCTCEEPGCAGFFEGLKFKKSVQTIQWIVPSEEFEVYDTLQFKQIYTFDLNNYSVLINNTKNELINLLDKNPSIDFYWLESQSLRKYMKK